MKVPSATASALIYLAMIPIYAGIYACLPENFYHTTVAYEASIKRDALNMQDDIRDGIITGIRAHYGSNDIRIGEIEIDPASIRVFGLASKDAGLSFFLIFGGIKNAKAFSSSFSVRLFPYFTTQLFDRAGSHEFVLLAEQVGPYGIKLADLCPLRSGNQADQSNTWGADLRGFVVLPYAAQKRMQGYMAAQSGFPSTASGNFARMLYFSAITITTVGFGDIVPITGLARTLVASEAILGIVMIGFFLNAVSQRKQDPAT